MIETESESGTGDSAPKPLKTLCILTQSERYELEKLEYEAGPAQSSKQPSTSQMVRLGILRQQRRHEIAAISALALSTDGVFPHPNMAQAFLYMAEEWHHSVGGGCASIDEVNTLKNRLSDSVSLAAKLQKRLNTATKRNELLENDLRNDQELHHRKVEEKLVEQLNCVSQMANSLSAACGEFVGSNFDIFGSVMFQIRSIEKSLVVIAKNTNSKRIVKKKPVARKKIEPKKKPETKIHKLKRMLIGTRQHNVKSA